MKASIPTLGDSGWVDDINEGGSLLLSNFVTSDRYQSLLYSNNIHSLSYLVAMFGNNLRELELKIADALLLTYGAYFYDVEMEVSISTKDGESNINIKGTYTGNGKRVDLNRSIHKSKESIFTLLKE